MNQSVTMDRELDLAAATSSEPFLFAVASNLHKVMHLSRQQHLSLWRRILDLYKRNGKATPEFMVWLCDEAFVEGLLHDEVFWGQVGCSVTREYYARATNYLSAVYAVAALIGAQQDELPLSEEEEGLLTASRAE